MSKRIDAPTLKRTTDTSRSARTKARAELIMKAAAYQNQICLVDIANDYEWMLAHIATLEAERVPSTMVHVATLLSSDPYDGRDGFWLSSADRKQLSLLPHNTKLYCELDIRDQ